MFTFDPTVAVAAVAAVVAVWAACRAALSERRVAREVAGARLSVAVCRDHRAACKDLTAQARQAADDAEASLLLPPEGPRPVA